MVSLKKNKGHCLSIYHVMDDSSQTASQSAIESEIREEIKKRDLDGEIVEALYEEGKYSFNQSVDSLRESRETTIKLIRITLIVASIYVALFQLSGVLISIRHMWIVSLPFIAILVSMISFLVAWSRLNGYVLSPSAENILLALRSEHTRQDYLKEMSVSYFMWADENSASHDSAYRPVSLGILHLLLSFGLFIGVSLFSA